MARTTIVDRGATVGLNLESERAGPRTKGGEDEVAEELTGASALPAQ